MAYAYLLTRLLSEDHLSQKALADAIGIASATLRRLLNDQAPSAATKRKLEAFFQATPGPRTMGDLLGRKLYAAFRAHVCQCDFDQKLRS
ncbi:helix-turn-helix domain-containing protein [Lacticaseibacillus manihotivorans]|uniref:helix-turn-helix domain-containing protein n=1 Tax=Lacticaseibacillus manihotivorans TaxID=88233 RepID=UPI0006D21D39